MLSMRSWAFAVTVLLSAGIASCDLLGSRPLQLDAKWHEQALVDGHLKHWLAVAPSESGFLRANVTRAWRPREQKSTDLVAQSRLIYVLLSGYELTGDARFLDAARHGVDFLLRHFTDSVHGGFFHIVDGDGRVLDDSKHTYGHAFAIFALAHSYRVIRDERYSDAALMAWRTVNLRLRDAGGGFRPDAPRDFSGGTGGSRTQNPMMHLFEALLALYDASGSSEALAGARDIGDFVAYRLLKGLPDGGAYIPEWYNANWEPLPRDAGYVDLGHQFEWAYLLNSAEERGLPSLYAAIAQRVLDYAIKTGYDDRAGGTFNVAYADGTVVREKGIWQQSECLRTLMHYAALYGKPDMKRRYEQTLEFVQDELIDTKNGGWFMMTKSACARQACPDEQPDAYHMTGMHREALALAVRASAHH